MAWLTTEETAEILDYHVESVRRLLRQGKIKGKKFGSDWLLDPKSVRLFQKRMRMGGYSKRDPRRGR